MVEYMINHDRPNCIGCAACAGVCPDFWEMDEDGKSNIKGGAKKDDGTEEHTITEAQFACNKEAAESCPVNVIHLINKETNKKLI